jgi:hypothetical protein
LPIIHPAITMLLHSCPLVYSTRLCVRVGLLYDSSTFASGRVQLGRATNFGILTKRMWRPRSVQRCMRSRE